MKTKNLILFGIFAALTAVCSMVSIPLPFTPVPINLATLSVFLAGGLLGSKGGAMSQTVYVLLGAIGLPVFHNFSGGIGVIAGPTGGYIIGYIVAAFVIGLLIEKIGYSYTKAPLAMATGLFFCYLLGTLWFMGLTKMGLVEALMLCVVPFLIGDAIKIVAAVLLVTKLKPILSNYK